MLNRDGLKMIYIRQSAGKFRTGKSSTTIPYGSTLQAIGSGSGAYSFFKMSNDIVLSIWKHIDRKVTKCSELCVKNKNVPYELS